jgi:regulator of PEP synthase PpsR (kinase-PPPase family)
MVPGISVPPQLLAAAKDGVPIVCLTIREQDLERIRKSRYQNLAPTHRIPKALHQDAHYIDREKIRTELLETQKLARQYKWPVIDVTDKAIEETASEILIHLTAHRA